MFTITKDNPDGTREIIETVEGSLEMAQEAFAKVIEEQSYEYHITKTLNHWRTIRLFDEKNNQLAQES